MTCGACFLHMLMLMTYIKTAQVIFKALKTSWILLVNCRYLTYYFDLIYAFLHIYFPFTSPLLSKKKAWV